MLKDALIKFLPKKLPGETLCKFVQIFPPKVLVYIYKIFSEQVFIENDLSKRIETNKM